MKIYSPLRAGSMRDLYLISPALFPKTIHCTQLYGCSLMMGSSHHDVVRLPSTLETAPSAIVRSLPYPSVRVVLALATDSCPLPSPLPRGSNEVSTERTMASRTLDGLGERINNYSSNYNNNHRIPQESTGILLARYPQCMPQHPAPTQKGLRY